ncbi:Rod shape-determining protein MreD [Dawidia soli]|uniref:Rod shape-determining protein MreD n=1 Tax=Dawidia soli TaxID=2782352 RepID=A0AAP2DA76_9BACT|nr:Rod shape-determining protein MreD [Dawidia soli]MBT1687220.1 Rod shape-determining protein MreD [Dawidia soli]
MSRIGIPQIIAFFVYLLYQVMILQNVVLFHTAFCFLYVAYLLLLPVETNPLTLMGIGFVMGFAVDMFYESIGLHAFACVFVMYVRNYWLSSITPQGGYDSNVTPSMALGGFQWFVVYALPLVFIHHLMLFYMEAGGFGMFWFTLWKSIVSTFFTTLVILIAQFLFPGRRR